MLRFKSLPVILGVLAAVLWASPSDASIVQALELDELVEMSDRIFLGRVAYSESFEYPNGYIGTWHRIVVERDIRGTLSGESEVIIETLGGDIGDIGMQVAGEPQFTIGERVLVFASARGSFQAVRAVGMGQGVMRVRSEAGVERVRQTRAGMVLMRRNAQGLLKRAPGALPREERLDTFLSRVKSLVDRKAGASDD
jgi:hypothetical protein